MRRRISFSAFVLAGSLFTSDANAQVIVGRVTDKLESPLSFPKICILYNPDICTSGDDSGFFRISLPAAIKTPTQSRIWLNLRNGVVTGFTPVPGKLAIGVFGLTGRRLSEYGLDVGTGGFSIMAFPNSASEPAAPGTYLVRVALNGETATSIVTYTNPRINFSPASLRTAMPARTATVTLPDLAISKQGYRTEHYKPYPDSALNWITMATLGDSGYFRSSNVSVAIQSIDTIQRVIHTLKEHIYCQGDARDSESIEGKLVYSLFDNKLYLRNDISDCQGIRLSGNGNVLIGTWEAEDLHAELPIPVRPPGCPAPGKYSEPVDKPTQLIYRINTNEIVTEFFAESCPGDDLFYEVRNLFRSISGVKMLENTCRRTVFENAAGMLANVAYTPSGGRDSTETSYSFGSTSCKYVDPLLFANAPSTCPDPADSARNDFLACIKQSMFAALPKTGTATTPLKSGNGFNRQSPRSGIGYKFRRFGSIFSEGS